MKFLILRIAFNVLTFILIFVSPWWLALLSVFVGILLFTNFYEGFLFGYILDLFYGTPGETFYGTNLLYVFSVALFMLIALFLKKRLRFYDKWVA